MKADRLKVCAVFVLIGTFAGSSQAQKKSEREELGYVGPVRSVRTVTVEYTVVEGRLKAKKPTIEIERFNRSGVRLENSEYDEDGTLTWRVTPILSRGRKVGWRESSDPKEPPSEFFYKLDSAGNIIEQRTYDDAGKLQNHWVYTFDSQGRLIRETHAAGVKTYSYDDKGRQTEVSTFIRVGDGLTPVNDFGHHRRVLTYADSDYWISQESFSATGELVTRTFVTRDRQGNQVEDVTYDGHGNIKYRMRYENRYDRRGNLVRSKSFRLREINGKHSYQLEETQLITITYFRR